MADPICKGFLYGPCVIVSGMRDCLDGTLATTILNVQFMLTEVSLAEVTPD